MPVVPLPRGRSTLLGCRCSYPVTGGLCDIFSDLLGRQTQRTDLGGKRRGGTDLTTSSEEVAVRSRSVCILEAVFGVSDKGAVAAYITLTSLGSNLGAARRETGQYVSSHWDIMNRGLTHVDGLWWSSALVDWFWESEAVERKASWKSFFN